jgi:hypothetical protein
MRLLAIVGARGQTAISAKRCFAPNNRHILPCGANQRLLDHARESDSTLFLNLHDRRRRTELATIFLGHAFTLIVANSERRRLQG